MHIRLRWEVGSKSCRAGGKAWCASGTLIGGLRASHGSETALRPARQQRSRMSPAPVTHTRGLQAMPGDGPGDRHRGSGKGSRRRMSTAKGPAWLVLALLPFMDHRRWHPPRGHRSRVFSESLPRWAHPPRPRQPGHSRTLAFPCFIYVGGAGTFLHAFGAAFVSVL